MIDDKTNYSTKDEHDDSTTISLPKLVADTLQLELSDVHAWIQDEYNAVVKSHPKLSRRKKGNHVREIALARARTSPRYRAMLDASF